LLVVGRDPVEVGLDEVVAAQAVIAERQLDFRDRRFLNLEVGGEDGRDQGCEASGYGKDVLVHHVSFAGSITRRRERRSGATQKCLDDVSTYAITA
jgi:hypothetical protein